MNSTRVIQASLSIEEQYALKSAELDAMIAAGRNAEIQRLQQELEELLAIMTDMHALVLSQQPLIDTIESNIQKTALNTEAGVDQLEDAQTLQKKRRNRISTAIVVGVAAGLVVGGGLLVSAALGLSGVVGFLVGAGIVLTGLAVVAGIGYGIYSLFKCCAPKSKQEGKNCHAVVRHHHKRKLRQAPSKVNGLVSSLADDKKSSVESESLTTGHIVRSSKRRPKDSTVFTPQCESPELGDNQDADSFGRVVQPESTLSHSWRGLNM